jgi:hypothetical protein
MRGLESVSSDILNALRATPSEAEAAPVAPPAPTPAPEPAKKERRPSRKERKQAAAAPAPVIPVAAPEPEAPEPEAPEPEAPEPETPPLAASQEREPERAPTRKERRPSRKERRQSAADLPTPAAPPVAPPPPALEPEPDVRAEPEVQRDAVAEAPTPAVPAPTLPAPEPRKRALRKEPRSRRSARKKEARETQARPAASVPAPDSVESDEPEVAEATPSRSGRAWEHPLAPQFSTTQITHPPVYFKPRRGAQRLATILLLCTGGITGLAGWVAYDDRTTTNLGTFAILAVLTLIIWAFRISSAPAVLKIENGILEIEDADRHYVWDLRSPYTPIEVFGRPGRRKWRVWMHRPGSTTYVVTSAIVDPNEFMTALRAYRPEL